MTTFTILKDTLRILMEGTPAEVSYDSVKKDLLKIHGVSNVHDLQMWCITVNKIAVMVHLQVNKTDENIKVLKEASKILRERYKVSKTAIQIDFENAYVQRHCKACQGILS